MKTAWVIGNGLVGACAALALQRAGYMVTIADASDARDAASFGNAGHLAIEQVAPLASRENVKSLHRRIFSRGGPVGFPLRDIGAWLPFGLKLLRASSPARHAAGTAALTALLREAIPAWHRLALSAHADALVRDDGHFVVWETAQSAARGLAAWQAADLGGASVFPATASELAVLQAQFANAPVSAARFDNTGQLMDVSTMRESLRIAFLENGGTLKRNHVSALLPTGSPHMQAAITCDDGSVHQPDLIVVAAGVGSAHVLKNTYGAIPLIAERGYHIESRMDGRVATPRGLPVVFEDRNIILAPFISSLRMSGFTEFSRADSPPDPRKWERLFAHAHALGIPIEIKAPTSSRWVGSRPTLPDYLPAIGRHADLRNVLYAFGHNHLGVTLAAITAELIGAIATNAPPSISLTPFSLNRFSV